MNQTASHAGPRSLYRLHASSWFAGVLALLLLALWNVSGFFTVIHTSTTTVQWQHGWPSVFLQRAMKTQTGFDSWGLTRNVLRFDGRSLAMDVFVALVVAAFLALAFEWRRRRRPRLLSVSLKDLMVLTIAAAVGLAYWYRADIKRQQVVDLMGSWGGPGVSGVFVVGDQRLPAWIWNWLPGGTVKLGDTNFLVQTSQLNSPQTQLEQLAALSDVKALYLVSNGGAIVSIDEHADIVGRMKQLAVLPTHRTDLSDQGLAKLSNLTNLEWLTLGRGISDAGMQHLAGMTRLKGLAVGLLAVPNQTAQLSDAGLKPLGKLLQLQELQLSGLRFTKEGTRHLAPLERLEQLNIDGDISDDALEPIGQIKSLKILILSGQQISDAGVAHLSDLRNLQYLDVFGSAIGDRGLEAISSIRSLQNLYIRNSKITDDGVSYLLRLPELERIDLTDSQITDASIETLATIRSLKQVRLKGSKVSPEGIKKLKTDRPGLYAN
jgi:hypothetical protein